MSKNRDRKQEHRRQKQIAKKMTFHHWRILEKAIKEINGYEARKAVSESK